MFIFVVLPTLSLLSAMFVSFPFVVRDFLGRVWRDDIISRILYSTRRTAFFAMLCELER